MFGFIILLLVLSFVGRLFFRPFYGYYRPWGYPFGGWGMMSDILAFRFIMRLIPIVLVISLISWALR